MEPPDLANLDHDDPFDLFDVEARRLDRFFGSRDEAGWRRPSRCAGWAVRDVLAHLAGEEAYNHACLDGTVEELFARLERAGAPGGLAGFNEWCVQQRRDLPVVEVLEEWREANQLTRRRMRERGRDAVLATAAGPYPVGLQTFHYSSELATHADDVSAPVAPAEEPGRTGWRARVGRFVLAEQGRPVRVVPAGAAFEVRADGVSAVLPAPEFVAATVARLPDDHPLDHRLRTALACLA
ncbi:MAG: maleylpyruvate isomerase family mycothiol-dependent enzyme [Micromonosporaceae bacterium]|nr:maleylpyruvate isomerase family mycothiol-dependent enzyme [Micromonosporaceae bacterium]